MTTLDFLRAIWPNAGYYVIATPITIKSTGKRAYKHHVFDDIAAAAAFVTTIRTSCDVFYGIHSLIEPQVWKPEAKKADGTMGKFVVRTQSNSCAARALFFDLDVGKSTQTVPKYATQADAIADLKRFCMETQLPTPLIVSSGYGVHVYWRFDESMVTAEWRVHATKMRALAKHHGLKVDPARTTDSASVLRVAGTLNHKDILNPQPVAVVKDGGELPLGATLKAINDAVIRAGIDIKATPLNTPATTTSLVNQLGTQEIVFDGEPVSAKAMAAACKQVAELIATQGNTSEPVWFQTINLLRFTKGGRKLAHKWSAGYSGYSATETDARLDYLERVIHPDTGRTLAPTTCIKLVEVTGRDDLCEGCPFVGKVKSPIVAARYRDEAPPPVVHMLLGQSQLSVTIPEPPTPFKRIKDPANPGGNMVAYSALDSKGNPIEQVIYPYDLYPLRRVSNRDHKVEQQVWRVVVPTDGTIDFVVDADALYDRRKFVSAVANQGVYIQPNFLQHMQDYMVAYIAELQRQTAAESQCNHLGWINEHTEFVMPDKIIQSDGTARPASLSLGAQRASTAIHKKGDMAKQIELLRFWDDARYTGHQFFILGGLAAPLFHMTGHHGVIVNASGAAGSSKSTSLYTAASFFGDPELYAINGTNNGATVRGRNERVTVLANLPVCVDEITHMPVKDAIDLAMSITQPGHRIRLEQSGVERAASGGEKATIMLATANNSLHTLLSLDNSAGTAGSMRVVEITFSPRHVHTKVQADEYLRALKQNYGHLGELFVSYVIQHRAAIEKRIIDVMREVDTRFKIEPSERFWSAYVASVIVTCEIANRLGFVTWSAKAILNWVETVLLPYLRSTVNEEYSTPLGVLADYLAAIQGETLVTNGDLGTNVPIGVKQHLSAHYDMGGKTLWVSKKQFKDYCARIGANSRQIIHDLSKLTVQIAGRDVPVVSQSHTRKVLGAGTDYARAQVWCFAVDMRHPEVSGMLANANPATHTPAAPSAPAGTLKVVK